MKDARNVNIGHGGEVVPASNRGRRGDRKSRVWLGVVAVAAFAAGCGQSGSAGPNSWLGPVQDGSAGGGGGAGSGSSGASSGSTGASGSSGASTSGGGGGGTPSGARTGSSTGGTTGSTGSSTGTSGSSVSGSSGGVVVTTGGGDPKIPAVMGTCPMIATGNIMVLGQSVSLQVGTKQAEKKGAVMFYWHGTGSSAAEVAGLGAAVTEITGEGGVVASFSTSTGMGTNTGNNVWYTGDFAMADQILACAVQQLNIDIRRVYTAGCSAGGLQAGAMVYSRSSYLAASMPNSGGTIFPFPQDDMSRVANIITTHGKMGTDVVVIDFASASLMEDKDVVAKKGFAIDCDHGGGHCGAPPDDTAAQWRFCKDHPFGVSPEPYAAGIPSGFPAYCTIQK
jgi:hypothetical protein